jgi:hypothetical protein
LAGGGTTDFVAIRFCIDSAVSGTSSTNINSSANVYCTNAALGGIALWVPVIQATTNVYYQVVSAGALTPSAYVDVFGYKFVR